MDKQLIKEYIDALFPLVGTGECQAVAAQLDDVLQALVVNLRRYAPSVSCRKQLRGKPKNFTRRGAIQLRTVFRGSAAGAMTWKKPSGHGTFA